MTIQEAIKSGKLFRRKNTGEWFSEFNWVLDTTEDVLATDWELKPEPLVIQGEVFWKSESGYPRPVGLDKLRLTDFSEQLLGKRTKIRIEVINE